MLFCKPSQNNFRIVDLFWISVCKNSLETWENEKKYDSASGKIPLWKFFFCEDAAKWNAIRSQATTTEINNENLSHHFGGFYLPKQRNFSQTCTHTYILIHIFPGPSLNFGYCNLSILFLRSHLSARFSKIFPLIIHLLIRFILFIFSRCSICEK